MTTKTQNTPENSKLGKGRLREIISVILKHGLIKGFTPQKLRNTIEDLGPTFIKFGQILSLRPDMIPAEYCKELARLRVDVKPMEFSFLKEIIESEYGSPLSSVFLSFDEEPLGSASIAQVHKAVLKDGGRVVAVKVQRYGIRETMSRDIKLMRRAAKLLKMTKIGELVDLDMILDEIWSAALQETDFLLEAANADELKKFNADVAFFDCPVINYRYTTQKILVMKYIDGVQIDNKEKLLEEGYDLNEIGLKFADNYVKQIIDDGYFHADPHPGNIRILGGKIVWLDMGMMGRLSSKDRRLIRDGVKAAAKKDIDEIENIILKMSLHSAPIDRDMFRADIAVLFSKYSEMGFGDMNIGEIFEEVVGIAQKYHLVMPGGFFMLERGLLNLNSVLRDLSPELNPAQIIANHMSASFLNDLDLQLELKKGVKWLFESGLKSADIPPKFADFLKTWNSGRVKLNLKITDAERSINSIDKMASRLVKCIFSASLFLGACMICLSNMEPKIWGIHIVGWLAFAASIIIGVDALWSIRKKP